MFVSIYEITKDNQNMVSSKNHVKNFAESVYPLDVIINDLVNVYTSSSSDRTRVEIFNDLPNHQEILNTVQNILKESL